MSKKNHDLSKERSITTGSSAAKDKKKLLLMGNANLNNSSPDVKMGTRGRTSSVGETPSTHPHSPSPSSRNDTAQNSHPPPPQRALSGGDFLLSATSSSGRRNSGSISSSSPTSSPGQTRMNPALMKQHTSSVLFSLNPNLRKALSNREDIADNSSPFPASSFGQRYQRPKNDQSSHYIYPSSACKLTYSVPESDDPQDLSPQLLQQLGLMPGPNESLNSSATFTILATSGSTGRIGYGSDQPVSPRLNEVQNHNHNTITASPRLHKETIASSSSTTASSSPTTLNLNHPQLSGYIASPMSSPPPITQSSLSSYQASSSPRTILNHSHISPAPSPMMSPISSPATPHMNHNHSQTQSFYNAPSSPQISSSSSLGPSSSPRSILAHTHASPNASPR